MSRAGRPVPTGIDRIELAYAEHLAARAGDRLGYVAANAAGDYARLPDEAARRMVGALAAAWRDPDGAPRAIGRLSRIAGLLPHRRLARGGPERPVLLSVSHQNLHRPGPLARLKERTGAACLFFVHDLIPIEFPEYARPGHAERHRRRIATICALADGIVVNSADTARALAPHLAGAGRPVPVRVAHPGAEFAHLATGERPPLAAAPYFVSLGTIEPRKNHLLLLHLWRQFAANRSSATPRLVLVGQRGWENENIVDLLDRCPALTGLVEEHNALPDRGLPSLLQGARALLSPAFAEGYGMPLAEALALGTPVVCSDLAVFREVAGDVPDFLDPLDGPGWRAAILDYAAPDSPRRAAQLDRMAHWRAPAWEAHFDVVLDLIETVARAATAPAAQRPTLRRFARTTRLGNSGI